MKKYIALLLVLVTLLSLTACGKKASDTTTQDPQSADTAMELPDDALTLLNTVWNSYGEDDRFYAMGGSYDEDEAKNNVTENAPGKYDVNNEGITTSLMVPADNVASITDAAALMDGMLVNNFTCGAYHLKDGTDAKAFGEAMYKSITEQRFLCGAPEAILVAVLDNEYVVAAFGMKDRLDVLQTKLTAAYPGTNVLYSKMITY